MLIILISAAWIFILVVCVAVCKMAAVGDAMPEAPTEHERARPIDRRPSPPEAEPTVSVGSGRIRRAGRRRSLTIHGSR